jgi:hypothetical protein
MSYAPRILQTGQNISVSVGSASTKILSKNERRGYATITNTSDEAIYVSLGEDAVMGQGVPLLFNGSSLEIGGGGDNFFDNIYAICASGGKTLGIMELNTK